MNTIFSATDWAKLQEIFAAASELAPAERSRYIDTACQPCPELREPLEAWLATLDSDEDLDHIVGAAAAQAVELGQPIVGRRLGNYQLTGIVGRGGMGIVYRAIRADDVYRKEVAIKVAAQAMMTPALLQRFLDERQILANLDHKNIARIMDGGTTADGAPYVVMELVAGKPIDSWCDEGRLGIRERVKVFVEVCRAVEYAHRRLVVHRDLKPDNIYVTAEGEPKLLDFGIAKALAPEGMGLAACVTAEMDRLMTPGNASPEQVRGQTITTGTDVYQLGVLLYQLVTGRRPFNVSTARIGEMERLICETPAPNPHVNEDLDGIILHAMEKEPQRRYASASDLANDLERYLNGFPVTARGPSWRYHARKFVERHKLAVFAAVSALVLLLGSILAITVQSWRLDRERITAEKVAEFQSSIFSSTNPSETRGKVLTARDVLDQGAANLDRATGMDPAVRDKLLNTLAVAYRSQGIFDRAYDLFSKSLEIRKRLYGSRSKEAAETMGTLADLDIFSEDYYRAFKDADEWFGAIRPFDDRYDEEALAALRLRTTLEAYHNRLGNAEATGRQAIKVATKVFGSQSNEAFLQYCPFGNILFREGKWAEAEDMYRTSMLFYRKGDWQNSPGVIAEMESASRLGFLLGLEGRYGEAEPLLREVVSQRLKILGFAHDSTGASEAELGFVLGKMHQTAEAEQLGRDGLRSREAVQGGNSRNYGVDEGLLAVTYMDEGKFEQARLLLEHDVTLCRMHLGDQSLYLARELNLLGHLQLSTRQVDAAAQTLETALSIEQQTNGDESLFAAADHLELGRAQIAQGKLPEAEANLRRAVVLYRTTAQADRPNAMVALRTLGSLVSRKGSSKESQALQAEAAALRTVLPASDRATGSRP